MKHSDRAPDRISWPSYRATGVSVRDPIAVESVDTQAAVRWRWLAVGVFVIASSLNYLDRQLLAAVAPTLMAEYGLSNRDYGTLVATFSMTYMLMAPFAGLFIDRVGLRAGAIIAVSAWSVAGAATGLTMTLGGLIACRMSLGVAEAGGIPCASKASATYLLPRELGLGTAVHSIGITLGTIGAPLVIAVMTPLYGWRSAFVVCGLAGLVWVPLWWWTSGRIPAAAPISAAAVTQSGSVRDVLGDRRLWAVLAANFLIMTVHSLWMNWTTIYFVQQYGLSQSDANRYFAWIPPIFATLGGLVGAWIAMRRIGAGGDPLRVRLRMCLRMAPALLATAAIPLMPAPGLAAAAISVTFFVCMMIVTNLHVIPIDVFGAGRAAFTSAMLICSYALMQMVLSPAMGAVVDGVGFGMLCTITAVLPLGAALVLRASFGAETHRESRT